MPIKVSAIICTHNRAGYLEKAVKSLVDQTLPENQREIIVVDNASSDETKNVTNKFSTVYIYEPLLGLSRARNIGWQKAQGDYIAYLDDDAVADPEWLQKILEAFDSSKPRPGVVGGKVEPVWEALRPSWLSESMLGQLALLDWGPEPVVLNDKQWFVGANMAFPREVLEEIGGFDASLGRKGCSLLSMEENLARKKIEKLGYHCVYYPKATVKHHVPASRLTQKWFLERAYWNGISSALIRRHDGELRQPQKIRIAVGTLTRIMVSPSDLSALLLPAHHPDRFARKCSVVARLGHIRGLWR